MVKANKSVALPAVIDLDSLDAVRDDLIDGLDEGSVSVTADAVERVSTNALFMLLCAAETARRNEYELVLTQPSAAITTAIERLGLRAQFSGMIRQ
ncbi:MAG TPA: STAS domain-containing protein [Devosia sp.]|jgi:anti-anti-sigma regulatory factor|nr:STAS domain-containing protein [Devosia sp.]